METTITLFLFGFTCVLATSNCSHQLLTEDLNNCIKVETKEYKDFMELGTEETLTKVCRYAPNIVDCQLGIMERCPDTDFGLMKLKTQEDKRVFNIICNSSNPLRKKFLDNSRCLNEFKRNIGNICSNTINLDDVEDFCKNIRSMLACAEHSVAGRCGEDAKEVYLSLTNQDYYLRINDCL